MFISIKFPWFCKITILFVTTHTLTVICRGNKKASITPSLWHAKQQRCNRSDSTDSGVRPGKTSGRLTDKNTIIMRKKDKVTDFWHSSRARTCGWSSSDRVTTACRLKAPARLGSTVFRLMVEEVEEVQYSVSQARWYARPSTEPTSTTDRQTDGWNSEPPPILGGYCARQSHSALHCFISYIVVISLTLSS